MSPVGSLAAPQAAAVPKVPYHPPSQSTSQKCAISPGPEGLVSPRTKMTPLLHDRDVSIRPATDTPCPQWGWHSCLLEALDPVQTLALAALMLRTTSPTPCAHQQPSKRWMHAG